MAFSIKPLLSFDASVDARYFLGTLAKLWKATLSFMSVHPHRKFRFPLDGLLCNVMEVGFTRRCRKKFKFGINRMKNSDTLYEVVRTFMTAVVKKVTMAAVDINRHYSAFFGAIYMVHN